MSKLYVGNIPEGAKEKEIQELFQAFGEVEEVALLRGYGFVHFVKAEDASAALNALDDSEFMGSHIQVQLARTKGHGYGRGSGPPRPRLGRGDRYDRGGDRSSYRDGLGGYRDNRDSHRDRGDRRYGGGCEDLRTKDYRRHDDYYDRYDYDRYRGASTYEHYPERYYDDRYHERDYYSKYADYRTEYKGRSRSPVGRTDYYATKERSNYYEREPYREDTGGSAYRSRRW